MKYKKLLAIIVVTTIAFALGDQTVLAKNNPTECIKLTAIPICYKDIENKPIYWPAIYNKEEFKKSSPQKQISAAHQYFHDVIMPEVPKLERPAAFDYFIDRIGLNNAECIRVHFFSQRNEHLDHRSFSYCLKAAKNGAAESQYFLGRYYERGIANIKKNKKKAETWYKRALFKIQGKATKGDPIAQFILASMYAGGSGTKQDYKQSFSWMKKSLKQNFVIAQFVMGKIYANERLGETFGIKKNYGKAIQWFLKAAKQGNVDGKSRLSNIYRDGHGFEKKYVDIIHWLKKIALQGDVDAQKHLGFIYAGARGVEQNYAEALKWLKMAANHDDTSALDKLGEMYAKGEGVEKDLKKSVYYYQKAINLGSFMSAISVMSYVYSNSLNYDEVLSFLSDSIIRIPSLEFLFKPDLFSFLTKEYKHGGFGKGFKEAIKIYKKIANKGDSNAQFNLGYMYDGQENGQHDYAEANRWYRKAAKSDVSTSMFNLAIMYAVGHGVMTSGAAAADWYYKAGVSYLKQGYKEDALKCVERIDNLVKGGLSVPNHFLAKKLLAQIYSGNETATQTSPNKSQNKSALRIVTGTGWPVRGGYVVTNHHVVAGRDSITLFRTDGQEIRASVIVDDATNDLVILKPKNSKLLPPALPLAITAAQVGGHVFTIGYPHPDMMGKEPKLTEGIINARTGLKNDPRVYQISVPLQGGNSGGPLLNMSGEVIGITTAKMSAIKVFKWTGDLPQNVNYAVKVDYLRALLSSVNSIAHLRTLPARKGSLTELAKRIEGSVLMVVAQ